MKKHFNLLVLTALLLGTLFTACKKDDNDDDNTPKAEVITPGVGTEALKIGDKAQVAIDLYSTVAPSYGGSNGVYSHFLLYFDKGVIVYCNGENTSTFSDQMIIDEIVFEAPFAGKTDKNIGIGSTKDEVLAAYGPPDDSSFFGESYDIGITFDYDYAGVKVKSIEVE